MRETLEQKIAAACQELFAATAKVELTRPEPQFGDYSTNVALKLAKQAGRQPREIAEELAVKLRETLAPDVADISVAGPGFLNLTLNDEALLEALRKKPAKSLEGKTVVAEYSDPNPFKVLHAGHLYTSIVGDVIANLQELAGAKVHRVNFGGDVGLHVAKSMWGIITELGGEYPEKLKDVPDDLDKKAAWLANRYVAGNEAYDDDPAAKEAITLFNKKVYELHKQGDHDSPFAQIYWTCRGWSYDYFKHFYETIQVKPFRYYPESETAPIGVKKAEELLAKGVLEKSDGAVVFKGENHDLHTRVFLTREGLPTYETKDLGLIFAKYDEYHFDKSVIVTGNDIIEYMKVVLKVVEQVAPELARATTHLTHGLVKLAGGQKMSSRKGNVVGALDILEAAREANLKLSEQESPDTVLGAVKYAFLKNRVGGDIVYDPVESVSLEGNSGPYLQYAHARARSVLRKAGKEGKLATGLEQDERLLARKLSEYPETVDRAVQDLMPHHICTYLYELAQVFNRFYEGNRVIDDPRETVRLGLVQHYAETLQFGLQILGMVAPDKM